MDTILLMGLQLHLGSVLIPGLLHSLGHHRQSLLFTEAPFNIGETLACHGREVLGDNVGLWGCACAAAAQ